MTPFELSKVIFNYLLDVWWLWLPVVLAIAFFDTWMYYIRRVYWQGIQWVLLEIKPPRDMEQSPKIMEQVFAGFWGIFGTITTKYQKYVRGFIQDYFVFEIVGIDGGIHFFVRAPAKFRNLIESHIWSHYPQTEVKEVEDYVKNIPADIPNKNWDFWATKMKLAQPDAYPLRTYMMQLDVISSKGISQFIDPLGGLMEVMSKLRQGEQIWIQIFIRPQADRWAEDAKRFAIKLMEQARPAPVVTEGASAPFPMLSPGQRESIGLVEQKAAKKAYETKVHLAYLGRRDIFAMPNVGASMGFFNQFSALNGNTILPDSKAMTKAYYFLAKQRKIYKQRKMIRLLRERTFWEKGFTLNIEELASLYHFPSSSVKAPMTPWLATKKAEPPLSLPT